MSLGNYFTEFMSFCVTSHRPGVPIALSLLECLAELLGPNTEALSQVCENVRLHMITVCVCVLVSYKDVRTVSVPLYGHSIWDTT